MLKPLVDDSKYLLNGEPVSREQFLAGAKGFCFGEEAAGQRPACWPMESESLGVHPDQVQEATEHARSLGVPTEFSADANPIFTSPGHRKAYAEALGYYDKNGGYGDPQRR